MTVTTLGAARSPQSLAAWLDMLAATFPPHGILLAGAGNGAGTIVQWLLQRRVEAVLVEGDNRHYQHLARLLSQKEDLALKCMVIADQVRPVMFHQASNPAESGLFNPEQLHDIWPRLTSTESQIIEAPTTLDTIAAESCPKANWLIIDCLPADLLMQGATETTARMDVIICRVVMSQASSESAPGQIQHVQDALKDSQHRLAETVNTRHPAIAHAIFVRDVARQSQSLAKASEDAAKFRSESLKLADDRLAQIQALEKRIQDVQSTAAEQQAKASADALECKQQYDILKKTSDEASKLKNESLKLADDRLAQIQALEKRIQDVQSTAAEQQAKASADALECKQQYDILKKTSDEASKLKNESLKLAGDRLAQIQALEKRIQDLQSTAAEQLVMESHMERIKLELTIAEAHIELLKEILLPGIRS